jgi:predicted house-cleaning noncanonical NTP pyrophosphatase (MazG superfamily)
MDDSGKIIKCNKLIRDRIPEMCLRDGKLAVTRQLDQREFEESLFNKLGEECDEFVESRSVEELADIFEVINAILQFKGVTFEEIDELRLKKREERGSFEKRILLIETIPIEQGHTPKLDLLDI